jgi:hypothetical protein
MVRETPDVTLDTDASDFGWGFAAQDHSTANQFGQGKCSPSQKLMSINWRELRAMDHAIDSNAMSWTRKTVMVRSDNVTTCALVNKQGSRQHAHLHQLATSLLYLCNTHQIKLFAKCIPGRENHVVDHLSRQTLHPQHEVPLSTDQFLTLESMFGEKKLDLFLPPPTVK